jgi:hypothetical protein
MFSGTSFFVRLNNFWFVYIGFGLRYIILPVSTGGVAHRVKCMMFCPITPYKNPWR